jgi:hypothetical protein
MKAMDNHGLVLFVGYFNDAESAKVAYTFCKKTDKDVAYGKIVGYRSVETL